MADQLPIAIKEQLAAPLNCPAWVVHQASGSANERKGNYISHTDAKGTKSWGTYFNVGFTSCTFQESIKR